VKLIIFVTGSALFSGRESTCRDDGEFGEEGKKKQQLRRLRGKQRSYGASRPTAWRHGEIRLREGAEVTPRGLAVDSIQPK